METNSNKYNEYLFNDTNDTLWVPDVMVLGPGGAKGLLELGFLLALEQEGYYSNTRIWMGCSVGAAIALLIVCGCTITDIINDFIGINIINDITDINIDHISDSPGLLNIKSIENLLKLRISEKFGMVPTLRQLYMVTGILLEIKTFNVDKKRSESLSKNTEPDLSSVEAVMMSVAIPGLIEPRVYKGYAYADGALGDPYPVLDHDNGINKILGVYIEPEHSTYSSTKNPIRYLYRCALASMEMLRNRSIENASEKCKHVALKTPIIDTTGLTLNINTKKLMIEHGYKTGLIFLNRVKHPNDYRLVLNDNEEIPPDNNTDDGVLDKETVQMLNMLSDDQYHPPVFNDEIIEDLFVSDEEINNDEESLFIPVTPNIRRTIEQICNRSID